MNTVILNKLKELKPILNERYGIEEFAVFGSVARGEEKKGSDIDIVVLSSSKGYFELIDAQNFLKERLKRDIDIGFLNGMKTFIKNRIKKDLIYV